MTSAFFPNLPFGWAFLGCLGIVMALASYLDLKSAIIPKQLSVTSLGLGLLMNVIRGAWLGSQGQRAWYFTTTSTLIGGLDGLLFALAGFLFAFALFFVLWILGVCGGGDVKIFAAMGAWIGPRMTLYVLAVTLLIIAMIVLAQSIYAVFTGQLKVKKVNPDKPVRRRLITFALPLTVAVAVVVVWKLGVELQLIPPRPAG
jgi:Flp pilus assembly protein protease CpaA